MTFDLLEPTNVMIDGVVHKVHMENGMTGIGSRKFWIDGKSRFLHNQCVRHTDDITQGDHSLYLIKWRDTPWDKVHIFISKKYESELLSPENAWREPWKVELTTN